jgi:lipid-A-disaccharide synthase
VKVRHFSQPNLLGGAELVPEIVQADASPENLSAALARWLDDPGAVARVTAEFARIHAQLRCDGAERAAAEIAEMLAARMATP